MGIIKRLGKSVYEFVNNEDANKAKELYQVLKDNNKLEDALDEEKIVYYINDDFYRSKEW